MVADVRPVGLEGAVFAVPHVEVLREQLIDGGFGARVATFVDLVDQPRSCSLCLVGGVGSWWYDLHQVVALLGDGIDAGLYANAESPARQLVDHAPLAPSASPTLHGEGPYLCRVTVRVM